MEEFPEFMRSRSNRIGSDQQNTDDVEGFYYTDNDGGQMAFWTARSDRTSKRLRHDLDEYMVCISGKYTAYLNDKEVVLNPRDDLFIPKGTEHWGR